jgi:hypothetical protein
MCVSTSANTTNTIAKNLIIDRPFIYDFNISTSSSIQLPEVYQWLIKATTTETNSTTPFYSSAGFVFYQMAKSKSWGKDFWDDLVAPYFEVFRMLYLLFKIYMSIYLYLISISLTNSSNNITLTLTLPSSNISSINPLYQSNNPPLSISY